MKLIYTLSEYTPQQDESITKATKAFQDLTVITAKHINPLTVPFIWFLSRFYYKTLTKSCGKYYATINFFLLP